jgi:hypothetical protein
VAPAFKAPETMFGGVSIGWLLLLLLLSMMKIFNQFFANIYFPIFIPT